MIFIKILNTIQKNKHVLIIFNDVIVDMLSNKGIKNLIK